MDPVWCSNEEHDVVYADEGKQLDGYNNEKTKVTLSLPGSIVSNENIKSSKAELFLSTYRSDKKSPNLFTPMFNINSVNISASPLLNKDQEEYRELYESLYSVIWRMVHENLNESYVPKAEIENYSFRQETLNDSASIKFTYENPTNEQKSIKTLISSSEFKNSNAFNNATVIEQNLENNTESYSLKTTFKHTEDNKFIQASKPTQISNEITEKERLEHDQDAISTVIISTTTATLNNLSTKQVPNVIYIQYDTDETSHDESEDLRYYDFESDRSRNDDIKYYYDNDYRHLRKITTKRTSTTPKFQEQRMSTDPNNGLPFDPQPIYAPYPVHIPVPVHIPIIENQYDYQIYAPPSYVPPPPMPPPPPPPPLVMLPNHNVFAPNNFLPQLNIAHQNDERKVDTNFKVTCGSCMTKMGG